MRNVLIGLLLASSILLFPPSASAAQAVALVQNGVDESAGGVAAYKIETPTATYFLEKSGAGLSSMLDKDGRNWLGFRPRPDSRAAGEFRGFPNAVYQQAGNYFHPRNAQTDPATATVEYAGPKRVSISAVSDNGLWACRYDFFPTHCTFTMTKMPSDKKYWVLYEGTPGGQYDDTDWWMTSAVKEPQPLTTPHEGDIPGPEWIVFGDRKLDRVMFLLHHEDDQHPDRFYPMDEQMTVFGFGRKGTNKFLDYVPQRVSIGFLETTKHAEIGQALGRLLPSGSTTETGVPSGSTAATRVSFKHIVIDNQYPRRPHCKTAGDINGDGLADVIVASCSWGLRGLRADDDRVGLFWYDSPTWTKHRIDSGNFTTDMQAADMDGDGDLDDSRSFSQGSALGFHSAPLRGSTSSVMPLFCTVSR